MDSLLRSPTNNRGNQPNTVLAQIAAALLHEDDPYEVLMTKFTVDQLRPFAVAKGLKVPKRKAPN
eukprot:GAFH01000337.1.p6 GENE.GAFH01000337.1~~GAFH01000337.1.p6  ORF type:complete len:65 (+),score=11.10 GAFH01000337.1:213-407(+)